MPAIELGTKRYSLEFLKHGAGFPVSPGEDTTIRHAFARRDFFSTPIGFSGTSLVPFAQKGKSIPLSFSFSNRAAAKR